MLLVVGLGNPGERYEQTRHNLGFMAADELATAASASWKRQFQGLLAQVPLGAQPARLLKPLTFMNASGRSVAQAAAFFKIEPADVVVIHDELDLPFGTIRLKSGGGSAGHNGLRSISSVLGGSAFQRVRLGIGRPGPNFKGSIADYVLQAFAAEERPEVESLVELAASAVIQIAREGMAAAMNTVNSSNR